MFAGKNLNDTKKFHAQIYLRKGLTRCVLHIYACVAANTKSFYHDLRLLSVRNSLDNNLLNVNNKKLHLL